MKLIFLCISLLGVVLLAGCSDSGETPTEPVIPVIPELRVNDITVLEGITGSFRISLNKKADSIVIIDYFTNDFTAVGAADYTIVDTTRDTFNIGDSLIIVFVQTNASDGLKEPIEQFELNVIVRSGAKVVDSVGIGTILDIDSPRFSNFIKPLLTNSCAKAAPCHSPINPSSAGGGMYLGAVDYQTVINATGVSTGGKVVIPNASAQSAIYQRISTSDTNIKMPQGGPYLDNTTIAKVAEWINFGAQEN